jgi:hypothetical protein
MARGYPILFVMLRLLSCHREIQQSADEMVCPLVITSSVCQQITSGGGAGVTQRCPVASQTECRQLGRIGTVLTIMQRIVDSNPC